MSNYFSDRELGARPRTDEVLGPVAWAGIVALAEALARTGAFGASFPDACPDGQGVFGTHTQSLRSAIEAEVHGISWPLRTTHDPLEDYGRAGEPWVPSTLSALDFVEFAWRNIARPIAISHHPFFHHDHLRFDQAAGREKFREDVNRIIARNGLAYELGGDGQVHRLLPAVIGDALKTAYIRTGDSTLDVMLEESRKKFSDPEPLIRREALERLFDCWERIKSLSDPKDKAASIRTILDRAAGLDVAFRGVLEAEAKALTSIGNSHLLRHHEVRQTPVIDSHHVDNLYHRMFAMVQLLIRKHT